MAINNYAENCTFIEKQYVGVQQVQAQYVGSGELAPDTTQPDGLKLANLCKYVPLPERVEDIARQLQTVKCAQDFKQVVRQIHEMCATQQERATIVTKPFREALLAFIPDWHPTDSMIYQHCKQIFDE